MCSYSYEYVHVVLVCVCSQHHLLLGHLLRRALLALVGAVPRRGAEQRDPVDAHAHRRHSGRARARTALLAARLLTADRPPPVLTTSVLFLSLSPANFTARPRLSPLRFWRALFTSHTPSSPVQICHSYLSPLRPTPLPLSSSVYSISHLILIFSPLLYETFLCNSAPLAFAL